MPSWRRLFAHCVCDPFAFALERAVRYTAARRPRIPMTTKSSIRVWAERAGCRSQEAAAVLVLREMRITGFSFIITWTPARVQTHALNARAHSRRANDARYANKMHARRRVQRDSWGLPAVSM